MALLKKYQLPNNRTVDVTSDAIEKMKEWRQIQQDMSEAGGFLTGYQNDKSSNIIIDNISHPYFLDYRTRIRFDLRDPRHYLFLYRQQKTGSQYLGTWHTHPENIPEPSERDWHDWKSSLQEDRSVCDCMFFIVVGIVDMRIWAGFAKEPHITELYEIKKRDGIYLYGENRNKDK